MDQLRGPSVILFAAIGVIAVWVATRMFQLEPNLPETTDSPNARRYDTPASDRLAESGDKASRSAAEERIRRLQAVIRSQRDEIQQFRDARAAAVPGKKPVASAKGKSLLDRLPDLSALTSPPNSEESADAVARRLQDVRALALELSEQLEAAETIVEMQNTEIEDLREELDVSRERAAQLAADREELDDTIGQMLEQSRELEAIATRTLINLGPAAAPAILPLLEDERLYVRSWVRDLMAAITDDGEEVEPGGDGD